MFDRIREDIQTVFAKDPAARTAWEVVTCYPGLHALWLHRVAHFLWQHRLAFLGRLLSHLNRWLTGIEIHPGARIGRRLFIDHGMGTVIGETAEIGDDVLMYQGVLLGGTRLQKIKRHPTIGNRVVIGAGAKILGAITVGDGARIGAGSVVVKSVSPGTTIVGVPGRVAWGQREQVGVDLAHDRLPDPVLRTLSETLDRQGRLEGRVQELERAVSRAASLPSPAPEQETTAPAEPDIRRALRGVIDPEIGINIVDLGMVREVVTNGHGVEVRMVTCSDCSHVGHLIEQVRRRVRSLVHNGPVQVVVLDEAWSWSDAAPHLIWGEGI